MKTGDRSAFLQNIVVSNKGIGGAGDEINAAATNTDVGSQTFKVLPPGFEAEYKAKMKKLGDLQESYALGGQYDDVMKGRQTKFKLALAKAYWLAISSQVLAVKPLARLWAKNA